MTPFRHAPRKRVPTHLTCPHPRNPNAFSHLNLCPPNLQSPTCLFHPTPSPNVPLSVSARPHLTLLALWCPLPPLGSPRLLSELPRPTPPGPSSPRPCPLLILDFRNSRFLSSTPSLTSLMYPPPHHSHIKNPPTSQPSPTTDAKTTTVLVYEPETKRRRGVSASRMSESSPGRKREVDGGVGPPRTEVGGLTTRRIVRSQVLGSGETGDGTSTTRPKQCHLRDTALPFLKTCLFRSRDPWGDC